MKPFDSTKVTEQLSAVLDIALLEVNLVHHEFLRPIHFILAFLVRPVNPAGRVLKKHNPAADSPDMMKIARAFVSRMEEPYIRPKDGVTIFSQAVNAVIDQMYQITEEERGSTALALTEDLLRAIINSQDEQVESLFERLGINQWQVLAELKRDSAHRPWD